MDNTRVQIRGMIAMEERKIKDLRIKARGAKLLLQNALLGAGEIEELSPDDIASSAEVLVGHIRELRTCGERLARLLNDLEG